ncbi:MAG: GNAT family N-acetyltransferase [Chloroflexota bacterium]|nr:GNAT family N-acetyltransferase [Chloroflexota bacterium]
MGRRVRPFAEQDYTAYARIASIAQGERINAAEARATDARWDPTRYDRLRVVAVDEEDAPLGYGEIRQEPSRVDPRRYFIRLGVDPASRRRGIGAAIWERLATELGKRRAEVACLWAFDATACQTFITKRGFVEVTRTYAQVRAIASAPLPTPALEERVTSTGIQITTLAAVRDALGEDALEPVWELHSACRLDHAALGRATPQPFAEWLSDNVTDAAALPDAYFVALDGARYVGVSSVRRDGEDTLRIGITGVLPGYRRRGIARLLTVRVHAWAKAHGSSEIHTETTKESTAMLALNDSLGYPIVASWGGYELRLGG